MEKDQNENGMVRPWLLIVLAVVVIAAAGVLSWQYMQNKNTATVTTTPTATPTTTSTTSTADWKDYTNTDYGFSLKYPKDWTVSAIGHMDPTIFSTPNFSSPCNYDAGGRCLRLMVEAGVSYDKTKSLDYYFSPGLIDSNSPSIISKENTTLGGEPAIKGEIYIPEGTPDQHLNYSAIKYAVIHNNKVFTITYEEQSKDLRDIKSTSGWRSKSTFDTMLSTFQFTK